MPLLPRGQGATGRRGARSEKRLLWKICHPDLTAEQRNPRPADAPPSLPPPRPLLHRRQRRSGDPLHRPATPRSSGRSEEKPLGAGPRIGTWPESPERVRNFALIYP